MSEKERMDYYRKKYGFEPKKAEPKPEPEKKSSMAGKPEKASKPAENTVPKEEPKKRGFFRRIFGKRK